MSRSSEADTREKKRRNGPAPLPRELKRVHQKSACFTDEELRQLKILSAAVGMTCGEFLRAAAFDNVPSPPPIVPEINREAYRTLANAASNLNQIAFVMNTLKKEFNHQKFEDALNDVTRLSKMLLTLCDSLLGRDKAPI
jgi:hypothetical protein